MRTLIAAFAAVWLAACAQLVPAPEAVPIARTEAEVSWARVLDRFVDDAGRVDFRSLAAHRTDLDRYVAWVYLNGPNNRPELFSGRTDVMAYHLNAYNALAMYSVLEAGIPRSLSEYGLLRFFWVREVAVGGERMSLYRYENDVIRPLGEERVHFALNCMAAGCPRLPRRPFRAATLDAELDREARRFVQEKRNVQVAPALRRVRLSEIFDFFTEDFLAKASSLVVYVNRYREQDIPADFAIEFIPYDWTVVTAPEPVQ
jgi:hypothetical protein